MAEGAAERRRRTPRNGARSHIGAKASALSQTREQTKENEKEKRWEFTETFAALELVCVCRRRT
jgi:hypothetical protein